MVQPSAGLGKRPKSDLSTLSFQVPLKFGLVWAAKNATPNSARKRVMEKRRISVLQSFLGRLTLEAYVADAARIQHESRHSPVLAPLESEGARGSREYILKHWFQRLGLRLEPLQHQLAVLQIDSPDCVQLTRGVRSGKHFQVRRRGRPRLNGFEPNRVRCYLAVGYALSLESELLRKRHYAKSIRRQRLQFVTLAGKHELQRAALHHELPKAVAIAPPIEAGYLADLLRRQAHLSRFRLRFRSVLLQESRKIHVGDLPRQVAGRCRAEIAEARHREMLFRNPQQIGSIAGVRAAMIHRRQTFVLAMH